MIILIEILQSIPEKSNMHLWIQRHGVQNLDLKIKLFNKQYLSTIDSNFMVRKNQIISIMTKD